MQSCNAIYEYVIMAGVFRKISFVCGFASGVVITTKGLSYLESNEQSSIPLVSHPSHRNSDLELVLVQILFRHGARTPLKIVPGIDEAVWDKSGLLRILPHTNINFQVKDLKNRVLPEESLNNSLLKGGSEMGQLTIVGQQETYDLGKNLRQLYIDELKFIGGTYDPKTTFLRTTHIPRTIDSLRCLVAGMFQDTRESVSFWTIPINEEFLFPNWTHCGALRQYIKFCFKNAHKLKGYQEDMETFFDMIGGSVQRLTFIDIMDNLSCRRAHNKAFPEKMKHFMNTIENRSVQLFKEAFLSPPTWTNELILPLATGTVVRHLHDNMKRKVTNTNPYKFYLFSVHDTSIVALLCALGGVVNEWPPFASYIALELYKNKNEEYFVQILYRGKVVELKDCNQTLVPLSQFEEIASRFFVDDMETACQTVLYPPHS